MNLPLLFSDPFGLSDVTSQARFSGTGVFTVQTDRPELPFFNGDGLRLHCTNLDLDPFQPRRIPVGLHAPAPEIRPLTIQSERAPEKNRATGKAAFRSPAVD
jgi:hypothetical protein